MQLPSSIIRSLESVKGFNKEAFGKVHTSGEQVTSIRINNFKLSGSEVPSFGWDLGGAVPWTELGYYLVSRPSFTFDPLFHAGCYYVQEASSMFLEHALKQSIDLSRPLTVLDLCAAPGGKSTHIQSLISNDSLLVSNEVIRSRVSVLKDNIIKWGCDNVIVTNNDPADFTKLENYFDVIVVDAPCSGSGLFRRDPEAIQEWSENNVQLCSQRQQRILADVMPALKTGGVLIYSTCSYSTDEDEKIAEWLQANYPLSIESLSIQPDWGIIESDGGYRFWPDKLKGEGFFLAVFKKANTDSRGSLKVKNGLPELSKKETELIKDWTEHGEIKFVKNQNIVYAWPDSLVVEINLLLQYLKVVYSGVLIGELIRDKLVPNHALAMSNICSNTVQREGMDYETAIKYLQRKDLKIETAWRGWTLASFQGHSLGWMNILPGRINNYYPRELRILKERADD